MAFDADTQYYALPSGNAGAFDDGTSPAIDTQAQSPALAALLQQFLGHNAPPYTGMMTATPEAGSAPAPPPQSIAQKLQGLLSPVGAASSPGLPPLIPTRPDGSDLVQPQAQAVPRADPKLSLPKHNDTALRIAGVLSALSGGAGANIISSYMHQRDANDRRTLADTQQQQQQMLENQTAQASGSQQFLDRLSKLDDTAQEQAVRNMTPAMMAAYGYTPPQVQSQFFDKDGKFIPVGSDDSKQIAPLIRAQATALGRLHSLTTDAQQALHDGYKDDPASFEQTYGVPYAGFSPAETQRDANAATVTGNRETDAQRTAGIKMSSAQTTALNSLASYTPQMQQGLHDSYQAFPDRFEAKYGVPYDNWKPGQTTRDVTAAQAVSDRKEIADNANSTRVGIAKMNIAARSAIENSREELTRRGQDLTQQMSQARIKARAKEFNVRYGAQAGPQSLKEYNAILTKRQSLMKRMTELSKPGKDPLTGEDTLSVRDAGRIDADGNVVANPVPTAAYNEYMQLARYDQLLQQQQEQIGNGVGPASSAPHAVAGPAPALPRVPGPAPVTVSGKGRLPRGSSVAAPPASLGALPAMPVYTSPGGALPDFSGGRSVPVLPGFPSVTSPRSARTRSSGIAPGSVISGSLAGNTLVFHAPKNQAEFLAMTPIKKKAYIDYMRQHRKK